MKKIMIVAIILVSLLTVVGCFGNSPEAQKKSLIKLSLKNVPTLKEGYYELWTASERSKNFIVRFNVKDGKMFNVYNGNKIEEIIAPSNMESQMFMKILITNRGVKNGQESVFLKGPIENSEAKLIFDEVNIQKISAEYELATFSDKDETNEKSGIWFVKEEGGEIKTGLDLPPTPWGWIYEGWLTYKGTTLSMGKFSQTHGKDTLGLYAYSRLIPDFPGEDFLTNAPESLASEFPLNLANGEMTVTITLEPDIGADDPTGSGQFPLKILSAVIPKDTVPHTAQKLTPVVTEIPEAFAIIESE